MRSIPWLRIFRNSPNTGVMNVAPTKILDKQC